jgi:hypothetical protein
VPVKRIYMQENLDQGFGMILRGNDPNMARQQLQQRRWSNYRRKGNV